MKTKNLLTVVLAAAAALMLGLGLAFALPAAKAEAALSVVPPAGSVYESQTSNSRAYADEAALNLFGPDGGSAKFTFGSISAAGKAVKIGFQGLWADCGVTVKVSLNAGDAVFAPKGEEEYFLETDGTAAARMQDGKIVIEGGKNTYAGFYGSAVIPASVFGEVAEIDGITLAFDDGAAVNVNVFKIALGSLNDGAFIEERALFTPAGKDGYSVQKLSSAILQAGQFHIYESASAGYGNTKNYVTFPEAALTEEGYIDTSVYKGVIVSVDLRGTQTSGYFYDAMSVFLSDSPTTEKTSAAKLCHIDRDAVQPAYKHDKNCAVAMNYYGDVYMSFADCGIEEGALIMPYIAFNSGHKGLAGKSYYMSYRLVSQTIDELYTAQADLERGTVSFSKLRYAAGEEITFTLQPQEGYIVQKAYANGEECTAQNGVYAYAGGDLTVTAEIVPERYSVELYDEEGRLLAGEEYELTYDVTESLSLPVLPDTSEKIFLGWFDGTGKDAVQVGEIAVGTTGDLKLYARFTDENVVKISVEAGEGGKAEVNRISAVAGTEIIFSVSADYGYKIAAATLNGKDILPQIEGGRYTVQAGETDLHFAARFEKISVYTYRGGDAFFAYDSFSDTQGFMGAVFAQFDAVNIRSRGKSENAAVYGGIAADTGEVNVSEDGVIAVRYNQLVKGADLGLRIQLKKGETLYSAKEGASYIAEHNGGREETLQVKDGMFFTEPSEDEAFCGTLYIPVSAFGGAGSFDKIVISSKLTSYVRHNIGEICAVGAETVKIWDNSRPYEKYVSDDSAADLFEVSAMQAGEVSIKEVSKGVSTTWGYEQYGFDLPAELVGQNGAVDLKTSGVKGMLITVRNDSPTYLNYQIGIIDAKYADAEGQKSNAVAGYRWITASSTKTVYCWSDGRMKEGGATIIPSGFDGKIYVPFSDAAFIKGNGVSQDDPFPTEILPYIYGGLITSESGASVVIESIEFVVDDSAYIPYNVGIFESNGGTVTSDLDSVGAGTSVTITAVPDDGYRIGKAELYIGEEDARPIVFDAEGKYTFVVTDVVIIDVSFEEISYAIRYVLPEGASHENAAEYTVLQSVTLSDPVLEGYVFEGWYLTEDFSGEAVTQIPKGSFGDVTLYAKFAKESGCKGGCASSAETTGTFVLCGVFAAAALAAVFLKKGKNER